MQIAHRDLIEAASLLKLAVKRLNNASLSWADIDRGAHSWTELWISPGLPSVAAVTAIAYLRKAITAIRSSHTTEDKVQKLVDSVVTATPVEKILCTIGLCEVSAKQFKSICMEYNCEITLLPEPAANICTSCRYDIEICRCNSELTMHQPSISFSLTRLLT